MYQRWRRSQGTAMTTPARQTHSRRLPPLQSTTGAPKQGTGGGGGTRPNVQVQLTRPRKTSSATSQLSLVGGQSTASSMVVTGHPLTATGFVTTRSFERSPDCYISSYDLDPDVVLTYLNDNPEFVDRFVFNHVKQDRIEKWLQTKHGRRHFEETSNGGSIRRSKRDSISKWKFSPQIDKHLLLRELTEDINQIRSKGIVLNELAACVAAVIDVDGYNIYLVDEETQEICYSNPSSVSNEPSNRMPRWKLGQGSVLSAYVAHSKQAMRLASINDIAVDERFPGGVGTQCSSTVQYVLCLPILQYTGEVLGVVELLRENGRNAFTKEDEEVSSSIMLCGAILLKNKELYVSLTKQKKMNEFLLTVTRSIFQDIVSIDTVIMKIMNYAKTLVDADRTALFLTDNRTRELYARVFDMGGETEASVAAATHIQKEIRFPMTKGIAGYVATTGSILNIPNAYDDERFNREVDILTGYTTKTILCMPINIRGSVIGVVQMVNKLTGVFTKDDEESFEMFAVYCGLALHQAKLYEKVRRSEQKYKVALDVLSYHNQATEEEVQQICAKEVPQDIPELILYDFSPWSVMMEEQPLYVIYMFKQLLGNASRYSDLTLVKFTLTVRKNYRPVPYHNWAHAFSVAHAVYTVLMTSTHKFTPFESMALFVACLCHDMDHRGKTNAFMVKSSTPLAAIYSTSTMEHHHFNQTIAIMQNEGHNVFEYLTSDQYKQVLGDIKHCILATDLALFFGNQAKLKGLSGEAQFNWQEKDHRHLVMANCMTASDLCSMYKPWSIQEKLVYVIMEEFWQQGDEEKQKGIDPIPMMDREKRDELPQCQVGFLVGICLPCYEVLAQMLPQTQPMVDGAKANLKIWQDLAEKQQQEDIQEEMEQEVEAEQTSINVT